MRWLFSVAAMCIAVVYYLGIKEQEKDMEKMGNMFTSVAYALTGRDAEGQFAGEWRDYPSGQVHITEEEEDDVPYYFPPGLPKEEPYQEIGYLR